VETRVVTYTYDPLGRLTGAEYSTGERYEYAYDAVGNRTVYTGTTPLAGTAVTTYTYDAANRLLIFSSPQRLITYTWDARGNLIGDGTFTHAYNAVGKMVRAQSITATIAYTYTADGLRVAQAVAGAVTTYAWDWAQAVPELLQTCNLQSAICNLYLIGHETLGWWDGTTWAYILPDALGSVRQAADGAGVVVRAREWTPYGEEVGGWWAGLGYTGEWQDAEVGLVYLRARWYAPEVGIFTAPDPFPGVLAEPGSLHPYRYVLGNPVNYTDPSGQIRINEARWALMIINLLRNNFEVTIEVDFGWRHPILNPLLPLPDEEVPPCWEWEEGLWRSAAELEVVLEVAGRFRRAAGCLEGARRAIGGVTIRRVREGMGAHHAGRSLITVGDALFDQPQAQTPLLHHWGPRVAIAHELAHYWDWKTGNWWSRVWGKPGMLTEGMRARVGNEPGPTWYARTQGAVEDWAESVAGYLFPEYFQALEAEAMVNENYKREYYLWQAMPDRPSVRMGPGLLPLHLAYVEEQFRSLCGQ